MLKSEYKYIVGPKYEKNNLTFKEKILKPDIKKINENLESISKNEQILYENLNNNILEENTVFERYIYRDGNCFFRSVIFFLQIHIIITNIIEIMYIIN